MANPSNEAERFRILLRDLPGVQDPRTLCENVYTMLELLLRREEDQPLLRELSQVVGELIARIPFDGPPHEWQAAMRPVAHACINVLQTAKGRRPPPRDEGPSTDAHGEVKKDLEYWLPPHLAHLLARLDYVVPLPVPPEPCSTFDDLCREAIFRRIDNVLLFFQRTNPAVTRELPPPFLFSPEFSIKFKRVVGKFIYPYVRDNRQVRVFATNVDLTKTDPRAFWSGVDTALRSKMVFAWRAAWEALRLIEATHENGERVMQIKQSTKLLREMLQPTVPAAYHLPRITNLEIDLFSSLLDADIDWWDVLNVEWQRFQDFYEQEKDPRVFQQQAREGVLRDNLLAAAERFPEQWSDFLVLLCHRVFPRINIFFLESFVTNLGRDNAERERRAPYLMAYLAEVHRHPEVRERERKEDAEWKAQVQELRTFLKGFP
ncbi:MAG: hypothetical protein HY985_19350 [Magnetospirillum sp.]|nr:hypothetical protein [Magnetospirillum sp.]